MTAAGAFFDGEWRLLYRFVCVGGAHSPKGCGHRFTDRGLTQCPRCGNSYVRNLSRGAS